MSDVNEYTNDIVRDIRAYATYETSAGSSDAGPKQVARAEAKPLNLDELSAKEIDAYVNAGELTAEQVYEHESAAEHPRKTVLAKYAPKQEEASDEADSE
jgi:hypothetical protein